VRASCDRAAGVLRRRRHGDLSSIEGARTDGETDISRVVGERHPHFVATLRKPVIAAINGACAGIG
jgi:enoyl-CoA hydratase/carnithine racemase